MLESAVEHNHTLSMQHIGEIERKSWTRMSQQESAHKLLAESVRKDVEQLRSECSAVAKRDADKSQQQEKLRESKLFMIWKRNQR